LKLVLMLLSPELDRCRQSKHEPKNPVVAERDAGRCEYCHAPEQAFNFPFEVDHILPQARDGSDTMENLALACDSCNTFKSVTVTGWDSEGQRTSQLFNPRVDVWGEHFRYEPESNIVVAQTSTGRVTLTRLRINSEYQRRARAHWNRIGLYQP
jgi:hypothetical protein